MALPHSFRRMVSCAAAITMLISAAAVVVATAGPAAAASSRATAMADALSLNFPAPPPGHDGTAYSDPLTVTGGTGPYTWSVSAGLPPPGITLGAVTGVLAGTPTALGTWSFTVKVTDTVGLTATEDTSLMITPGTALTASAAAVNFGRPDTLTATVTPAAAAGAVTFTDVPASGPKAGQTVSLGTVALSGGIARLTTALPAFNANTVTATPAGDPASASAPLGIQVNAYGGEVIISQFRLSGPGGAADQYAELYNAGPAVPLAGFTLTASSGATETIPVTAPTLATGHSYLIAGAAYSLSAPADLSAATLGSAGLQVTAPDEAGTVTDAAGTAGAQTGFFSGIPLPALSGTPAGQYAWVRLETAGLPANTGSNAADFHLVSTSGGVIGGVQSALGSPAPQATGSPTQANSFLLGELLDPARNVLSAPNFVYNPGAPGLLTIRRTLKNTNTFGATITAVQLRITSLSEINGAPEPGVTTQPPAPARLRVIDPATPTSQITITGGQAVTVHNLGVDAPATAAPGGGLDTTLTIPLPGGGLAPGASVSIALSFAVDRHGPYWYGYDIDALTNLVTINAAHRTLGSAPRRARARSATRSASRYAAGHGTLP